MILLLGAFYFLFGITIGSFLNVCIVRIPRNLPIIAARSMCPSCLHKLMPLDMIPIISWLFLKRTCRYCGVPISARYPFTECLTGILYVLCFLVFGPTLYSVILCLFISCLLVAAAIDFDHTYVPDRIHLVILALAAVSYLSGNADTMIRMLLGALVPSGILLTISLLTKGGIGFGDIKLIAVSGLLLGFEKNFFAFVLAYLLAGLFYIVPLVKGKINGKDEIPMVPFFAAALTLSALFGPQLLSWYFNTLFHIGY